MGLISVRGGTLFSCLNKNATDLPLTPFPPPPPRPQSRRQKVINFMIVRNLRHCTVHVLFIHAVQNAFNLIGYFYMNFIPLNRCTDTLICRNLCINLIWINILFTSIHIHIFMYIETAWSLNTVVTPMVHETGSFYIHIFIAKSNSVLPALEFSSHGSIICI
jgi:hypothetical protein